MGALHLVLFRPSAHVSWASYPASGRGYPLEDWFGEEGALRPGEGTGARPSHCAAVVSVTFSSSGSGKERGGTMKQRGPGPNPVMRSMDGTDPAGRLGIGSISDLAAANVVVAAE